MVGEAKRLRGFGGGGAVLVPEHVNDPTQVNKVRLSTKLIRIFLFIFAEIVIYNPKFYHML